MPEFTKAKLSTLTASRLMASNGSKETVSADLYSWVAGTANQVNIADNAGSGSITLSLPQNIHSAASPTFAGMTFGSYGTVSVSGGVDLKIVAVTGSLKLDDSFRLGSGVSQPLKLAGATGEWTAIETAYGGEYSLLSMLVAAAPSTNKRYVWSSSTATGVEVVLTSANASAFPIGATYYQSGKSDVFVNGQLMAEGSGKDFEFGAPAGTDRVKLTFAFSLQSGDVVTLHRYAAAAV